MNVRRNVCLRIKKKIIIGSIIGVVLLFIIIFLLCFFNRKFDVTFDLNNGSKEEILQVKRNHTIDEKDIKTEKELGELFIAWYEVIDVKEKEDVLAKEPFDFNTKDDKTDGKGPTFTVNANQNVTWNIDADVKPSYDYEYKDYKNRTATSVTGGYKIDSIVESTGDISRITTDVKVSATTKAGQKLSLVINQYVA